MDDGMTRREFIKGASALTAIGVGGIGASGLVGTRADASASRGRKDKSNFVIIYTDDLGYGDLGCFGSSEAKTPHIDSLARGGVRFSNWYSACPACSPSRASLLTGRYPNRAGVPNILGAARDTKGLPTTEITLAKALKPLGYRTGLSGKWHLGVTEECRPNSHGFDEFFGILSGCVDYYSHIMYWNYPGNPLHDLWRNEEEVWENGEYLTELITDNAVDFIKRQRDDPFLLYVAYNAPHYPMHAPKKYLDRFPNLPPDRRIMAAMMAAVDDGVGEIVRALKKTGQYENTVIFFSSDNGPSSESRNWLDGSDQVYYGGSAGDMKGHKGSLFEGGIRMPTILHSPGRIPSGQVCDKVGAMIDVFPTFVSMAGGEVPRDRTIDGKDILPMVTSSSPSPHRALFWDYNGQLAVRQGNWKLVLDGKLDFTRTQPDLAHLSDLGVDPGEKVNLASREPALVEQLTRAAREWQASVTHS